tara:strand:- start:974 stop:1096 length:123 start_codon:yes stop_codon:yes gene_type:complete
MGSKDKEQGPKLVRRPAEKIRKTVTGLGLDTPRSINKFPC